MSRILSRIISGDGLRPTRFHNYRGESVDLEGLFYLPRTLLSTVAFKVFGFRPEVPWLGWRAIRHLDGLIRPEWRILEFGSGMSSIWFARRCASLVTIESEQNWYHTILRLLEKRGLKNVDCRLAPDGKPLPVDEFRDRFFDLVLVDGHNRGRCVEVALRKVKSKGYIFLDNSDVPWAEYRQAEKLLTASEEVDPKSIRYFTDFYPTQFGVNQGLLVSLR
jgi:predicted O-methyltransferase YrrM